KDTSFRRTWDRDEYERRARERNRQEREQDEDEDRRRKGLKPLHRDRSVQPSRDLLQARTEKVNLTLTLGKTQVVQTSGSAAKQPGFYCKVCDCVVKDSIAYLDHINGKKHQRNLGMSMHVERSTLEQVKARIAMLKERKRQSKKEYDLDERIEEIKRQEDEQKRQRKERKKEKRKQQQQTLAGNEAKVGVDADMA
ncbi:U4/U6.U5 snRNP associated protein, partial [Dimargaris verticillata]